MSASRELVSCPLGKARPVETSGQTDRKSFALRHGSCRQHAPECDSSVRLVRQLSFTILQCRNHTTSLAVAHLRNHGGSGYQLRPPHLLRVFACSSVKTQRFLIVAVPVLQASPITSVFSWTLRLSLWKCSVFRYSIPDVDHLQIGGGDPMLTRLRYPVEMPVRHHYCLLGVSR